MTIESNNLKNIDVLIVGAGFAGSVAARELADAGRQVLIIDKRSHIAGNAYDSYDKQGIMIHNYGPHIFHTNSDRIIRWLSRFTEWRFYEHRVLAKVNQQLLPIPINQTTINNLYGLDLDEQGITDYLEKNRIPCSTIKTSEDVVLNSVGHDLCEKFFRGYTRKQWGVDLSELSAGVAARIPTRTNTDDRYFTDTYQLMPLAGYKAMFERMLDHPNITIELGIDFCQVRDQYQAKTIVYTGPIDEYYDYCFGKLPYRSLRFEHSHDGNIDYAQTVGTINYPNDYDYTRTTEFKHLTGQQCQGSSFVSEYPQEEGEPYYPIPRIENESLYKKYQKLTEQTKNVYFIGRLAQYRYYNMDQVVASALQLTKNIK
jgi:UDP-galactopyranose mutase